MYYLLMSISILIFSCSTGERSIASLSVDKVAQDVKVSQKSFRKLSWSNWAVSETCVVDFSMSDYNKTPKFLQNIHQARDRFHGLFVEAMCGSYEKTRRMAVKKNLKDRLKSFFTGGAYSRFEVISECTDGRVLIYQSPGGFSVSGIFDPEWCGSHSD